MGPDRFTELLVATSENAGIFSEEFSGSIDLLLFSKAILERKTAIIQRIERLVNAWGDSWILGFRA